MDFVFVCTGVIGAAVIVLNRWIADAVGSLWNQSIESRRRGRILVLFAGFVMVLVSLPGIVSLLVERK